MHYSDISINETFKLSEADLYSDSLLLLPLAPSCGVVSRSLSSSSTATLVHAFIVNRLDHCSSLYCGLPQVRLQPLDGVLREAARMIGSVHKFDHISDFIPDTLHWLPVRQRILYRLSSIVWRCVLRIAPTYLLDLFTLHRRALADNLSALPPEVILWYLMLARPLNSIGHSRLWVPLLGTVSHLNSALFLGICPVRFTSSLKPLFSSRPGLVAPLSSYIEVALYKFHR